MECWLGLAFRSEVLHNIYGIRYSLKQAQIGLVCPFHGALSPLFLLNALPLQEVPKSTENFFTELRQELMGHL